MLVTLAGMSHAEARDVWVEDLDEWLDLAADLHKRMNGGGA